MEVCDSAMCLRNIENFNVEFGVVNGENWV